MKHFLCLGCLLGLITTWLGAQIAIYGDTRSQDDVHAQVVQTIALHKPAIAFHTGDLTNRGDKQAHFDRFFALSAPLTTLCRIYPAKGNHERNAELFLKNFPWLGDSTFYTVEHDNLLFIVLDSTLDLNPSSRQYLWLEQTLAGETSLPKIVILHHPVFSSGTHGDELGLGLFLPELFSRHGVKAVFSGHEHSYERSLHNGVSYLVTGGGGAPLCDRKHANPYGLVFEKAHHFLIAERKGNQLLIRAWDIQNHLVDSFLLDL